MFEEQLRGDHKKCTKISKKYTALLNVTKLRNAFNVIKSKFSQPTALDRQRVRHERFVIANSNARMNSTRPQGDRSSMIDVRKRSTNAFGA